MAGCRAFRRTRTLTGAVLVAVLVAVFAGAPAQAQERPERLNLTLEDQGGYGRLVLTFPDRLTLPAYRVELDANVLTVAFDAPVETYLPEITEVLGDYAAVARLDPDRRGIRVGLKGAFRVNSIEAGERLYIDILPPGWEGLEPGLPSEVVAELARRAEEAAELAEQRRRARIARENTPTVEVRVGRHPTFTRLRFSWSIDTDARFGVDGDNAEVSFAWPVAVPLIDIKSDQPADIVSIDNEVTATESLIRLELANDVEARFFQESGRDYVLDIDFSGDAERTVSLTELIDEPLPELEPEAGDGEVADQAGMVPVETRQTEITPFVNVIGSTVRVVFPFEQDTPAAVFKRAGTVWLLFDTHVAINLPEDAGPLDQITSGFDVGGERDLRIVRMNISDDRLATLGSEGRAWVLSLGDILLAPTEPVTLERDRGEDGHLRLVADLARPARVHEVRDPAVGDTVTVVTAYPPARGLIRTLDYVDFQAIQAVHGLVIRPNRPEVSVEIEGPLVAIDAPDRLALSTPREARPADLREDAIARASFIDMQSMVREHPDELVEMREELMDRAAAAEGQFRDAARLDLAQFYLANRFWYEAIGVLEVLARETNRTELSDRVEITRAAADILAGRTEEGLDVLLEDRLADALDAAMWRVIGRVDRGDWERAREDALVAEAVAGNYPVWVRNRFLFAGTRAAIETGDVDLAIRLSNAFDFSTMSAEDRSRFDLLQGRIDEIDGRLDEAIDTYGTVIAADFRPTRAEAVFRTLSVLDRQERLDIQRATDTLHTQAMIWRGDELEAEMQALLGDLYFREGEYRAGFEVMRQAVKVHEESGPVTVLFERSRAEFADLFLHGRADTLEPVEALGIFYDFRNLTPVGARGDEMIRNLARRLVKVDLLEQAAGLLEYQIENRLEGAARAQVATDLAIIQIANRRPDLALRALYRTRLANLAPTLERQRRILEAKALIDAGRDELALDLLSSIDGRDATMLKVDAHWAGARYREAGELIEAMHGIDVGEPLGVSARNDLVKAAVAYALDADEIGLTRLRAKFSDRMALTPEWAVFDFVTSKAAPDTLRFREIVREIASVDSLNSFLAAYRARYEAAGSILPASARPRQAADA